MREPRFANALTAPVSCCLPLLATASADGVATSGAELFGRKANAIAVRRQARARQEGVMEQSLNVSAAEQ